MKTAEEAKAAVDKSLEQLRFTFNGVNDKINLLNVEIATAKEKIETSNVLNNSDKKTFWGFLPKRKNCPTCCRT